MTTYLYPPNLRNTTHFRDGGDDAMDVESSSEESIISSARSHTLSASGSPMPGQHLPFLTSSGFAARAGVTSSIDGDGKPVDQITTLLTCGNCSHDVVLSGPLITSNMLLVPSSPVPHILYTNSSPATSSEEADIHTYIQHTAKAIAQLNWEIARTNAILEMLVLEREKLIELVEDHKALLSPWRKIPTDILKEIFIRCEKGGRDSTGHEGGDKDTDNTVSSLLDPFNPTSGPLLLTQICKRWRTQALRMPELWSNIRIRIGRGELQESRRLPLLHAWLERSANHPLSICMIERSPRSPVYNSDSRNLAVGMLVGAARRWKSLYLILHSLTPHWGLFTNIKGMQLPLLEHCTIVTPPEETFSNDTSHPHEVLLNLLSGAVKLKELQLDYNVHILNLRFPQKTITSLDLYTMTRDRSIPIAMAFECLYHCPELRSLKVRCHVPGTFAPPSHLYHTNLISLNLAIDTDSGPGAESLLVHITPSNLTRFDLSTPDLDWDQDSIMSFIARCGEVKELGVKCKNFEKKHLMEILECERMGGVETLALDIGLNVTDDLLMDLSLPSSIPDAPAPPIPQRILVPRLKSIKIGGRLFISSDAFLSFITSRRYHSLPKTEQAVEVLGEVMVDCDALVYGFLSPYLVEQLDDLRWWGLRVKVKESGRVVYPPISR